MIADHNRHSHGQSNHLIIHSLGTVKMASETESKVLWQALTEDPLKVVPPKESTHYLQNKVEPIEGISETTTDKPTENGKGVMEDEETIWLRHMGKQFREIAGVDEKIDLDEFKKALNVKDSFFADRFFALFDADKSGWLTLDELTGGLHQLTKGSHREKLRFLFDVYDVNGSGTIDREEVKEMLKSCVAESSLRVSQEDLEELATLLFESADEDNSGYVSFEEMLAEFEKTPETIDALTISAVNWLKPPSAKKRRRDNGWMHYFSKTFIQNNLRLVVFLVVYFLINIGLFVLNAVRYRHNNGFVIVARGTGMTLNFNGAFVVALMLRYTLTWLRTTPLRHVLPFDESVMLHKLVGYVICFFTFVHTVCHLGNIGLVVHDDGGNGTSLAYWEYLFTLRSDIGWTVPGFAYLSGVILDVILVVMFVCSLSFVRRGGYFQLFYWTHGLYVFFIIFLVLHAPIFCYFFILPGLLFICEKIYNSRPLRTLRHGRFYVKEVNLLSSRVTHLEISRPKNFYYEPGDYVFIQLPDLAANEWHPFTISSAPELKDVFWLHIRGVGNWTNRLHEFFQNYTPEVEDIEAPDHEEGTMPNGVSNGDLAKRRKSSNDALHKKQMMSTSRGKNKRVRVRCFIDGPYGTPTREIMNTEHAVLIGSGIGVTPYASILQSIMYRHRAARVNCPQCQHVWYPDIPEELLNVKKVDFIWINRDQRCFEWFVSLLTQLEAQEAEDGSFDSFLNMQMYMTAAASKNDMKGVGLQMALDLLHDKRGTDLITGLKTKTRPGRPNWEEVFSEINTEKKGHVKVYFCGPPTLAKVLRSYCEKFKFEFHKESF